MCNVHLSPNFPLVSFIKTLLIGCRLSLNLVYPSFNNYFIALRLLNMRPTLLTNF